eukprot:336521_1
MASITDNQYYEILYYYKSKQSRTRRINHYKNIQKRKHHHYKKCNNKNDNRPRKAVKAFLLNNTYCKIDANEIREIMHSSYSNHPTLINYYKSNEHHKMCLICKEYFLQNKLIKFNMNCTSCLLYLRKYTEYTNQYFYEIYRICINCCYSNDKHFCMIPSAQQTVNVCPFRNCIVCNKNILHTTKDICCICAFFFCFDKTSQAAKCGVNSKCLNCLIKQEKQNILKIIVHQSNYILCKDINHIICKYSMGLVFKCSHTVTGQYRYCQKVIFIDSFAKFSLFMDHQNNPIYYYYINDKYLPENRDKFVYVAVSGKYIRIFCPGCTIAYFMTSCKHKQSSCQNTDTDSYIYCFNHPLCLKCGVNVFNKPCSVCETYLCSHCIRKNMDFYREKYGKCRKCYNEYNNKMVLRTMMLDTYKFNILSVEKLEIVVNTIYNYSIGFYFKCGCCNKWIWSKYAVSDMFYATEFYSYWVNKQNVTAKHLKNLFVDVNDEWGFLRVFCQKCTSSKQLLLAVCNEEWYYGICSNWDIKSKDRCYVCNYPKDKSCFYESYESHSECDDEKSFQLNEDLQINTRYERTIRKNNNMKQSSRRKTKNRKKNKSYWKRKNDRKGNILCNAKWKQYLMEQKMCNFYQ